MTKKLVKKSLGLVNVSDFFTEKFYTKAELLDEMNKNLNSEVLYKKELENYSDCWDFKAYTECLETDGEYEARILHDQKVFKSTEKAKNSSMKAAIKKFGTKEELIKALGEME